MGLFTTVFSISVTMAPVVVDGSLTVVVDRPIRFVADEDEEAILFVVVSEGPAVVDGRSSRRVVDEGGGVGVWDRLVVDGITGGLVNGTFSTVVVDDVVDDVVDLGAVMGTVLVDSIVVDEVEGVEADEL